MALSILKKIPNIIIMHTSTTKHPHLIIFEFLVAQGKVRRLILKMKSLSLFENFELGLKTISKYSTESIAMMVIVLD